MGLKQLSRFVPTKGEKNGVRYFEDLKGKASWQRND
jgi:hypothetical protein